MAYNDITETIESRKVSISGTGRQIVREFDVENGDPEEVINLMPLVNDQHPDLSTYYVTSISIEPSEDNNDQSPCCHVSITYAETETDPRENEYGEVWEWGLATQQEHITSCHKNGTTESIAYPPSGNHNETIQWSLPESANAGTGIGVDGSGDVKGVDVFRPCVTLKVTKRFREVTDSIRASIMSVLSCTNSAWWSRDNYLPGQVLFIGASISKQKYGVWLVEYNFQIREKPTEVSVDLLNAVPVSFTPCPWDYVWYKQVDEWTNPESGVRVRVNAIESIHIARVYKSANFEVLGLEGP